MAGSDTTAGTSAISAPEPRERAALKLPPDPTSLVIRPDVATIGPWPTGLNGAAVLC